MTDLQTPEVLIQFQNNPIIIDKIVEEVGLRVQSIVEAAIAKPLNRYNIRPGRIFGNIRGKDRYRIIELSGNMIVYKDLKLDKILYESIDTLLAKWNFDNVVEISPIDVILEKIKGWLTPFLGGILVAALLAWLLRKLG